MLAFDRLTPEDYVRCKFEAECEVGLWEEYEIEIEDTYTTHEVNNHPWPCDFTEVIQLGRPYAEWIHGYRREGCRPKLRKIKRWRRVE